MARVIGHTGMKDWTTIAEVLNKMPDNSSNMFYKISKVGGKFLLNGKEVKTAWGAAGGLDDAVKACWKAKNAYTNATAGKFALGHASSIGKGIMRTALGLSTKGWMSAAAVAAGIGLIFMAYEKGGIAPAMAETYESAKQWGKENLPVDLVPNYGVWA